MDYLENRHHTEIQLGLERIKAVADRLQVLDIDAVVITVAGTNGKGSTVATLEAIYSEAGYQVGVYTSPHLLYFNERIRLNKQNISDKALCDAFAVIENARGSIHLTYFEMATLAALLYFKERQPDIIILEVGIGGRLDATNIVDADLAMITTIDFDHEAFLGNTRDAIGFEKAGILRQNQTLIYADANIPRSIVDRARELNVTLKMFSHDYMVEMTDDQLHISFELDNCSGLTPAPRDVGVGRAVIEWGKTVKLPQPDIHPKAAAAAVVASINLQNQLPITPLILERAFKTVHLAGRRQVVYDTICVILDVSHNPQAVKLLVERVHSLKSNCAGPMSAPTSRGLSAGSSEVAGSLDSADKPRNVGVERAVTNVKGKVHAVFSGLKDKDLCGLISPMHSVVDHWYTAVLDNKRAAEASMLMEAFEMAGGLKPDLYDSIVESYHAAQRCATEGDLIIVYGSFFVVSPIMLAAFTEEG